MGSPSPLNDANADALSRAIAEVIAGSRTITAVASNSVVAVIGWM